MSVEIYGGALRMCDRFRDDGSGAGITYELDADYTELLAKYRLRETAGEGSSLDRMTRLLEWLSDGVRHVSNDQNSAERTALGLLGYAFGKPDVGLNCANLSTALCECLLAVGIRARVLYMFPLSPYDSDNHVVCEAWCEERSKWVLLDPTYRLVAHGEDGEPLGVTEIRERLSRLGSFTLCGGANHNGDAVSPGEIREYYAKNMFWFMLSDTQGCSGFERGRFVIVEPEGFDWARRMCENIDYCAALWGGDAASTEGQKQFFRGIGQTVAYRSLDILK